MEAEIPRPNDFKGTFVGDAPVVVTRDADGVLSAWVNRCAHRGAMVCRAARGQRAEFRLRLSPVELRLPRQSARRAIPKRSLIRNGV